jgi:hypothetical protein
MVYLIQNRYSLPSEKVDVEFMHSTVNDVLEGRPRDETAAVRAGVHAELAAPDRERTAGTSPGMTRGAGS